jgi:hypothetical protein
MKAESVLEGCGALASQAGSGLSGNAACRFREGPWRKKPRAWGPSALSGLFAVSCCTQPHHGPRAGLQDALYFFGGPAGNYVSVYETRVSALNSKPRTPKGKDGCVGYPSLAQVTKLRVRTQSSGGADGAPLTVQAPKEGENGARFATLLRVLICVFSGSRSEPFFVHTNRARLFGPQLP